MKVAERVLDVTSTLEGEKVAMTIDPESMAHIMGIMTDLYSDPEMAVLREYSTNAFDAHVEAGIDRPIEITLPTPLSPYLKIRDFGEGLDADDIREIYSRYGASTKRNSNDVVGMLGLGCKSALTYSDQFTISAVKAGIKTQIAVSRDQDGGGSMTLVDTYETDESSGVEIVIPAKQYNHFEGKAIELFRFWKPGTVLVGGEAPKPIDGFWIADDLLLTQETDYSVVVMGNVAYPMDGQQSYGHRGSWNVVAFVPIGAVYFTPSREALQFNSRTKATIETLKLRIGLERDLTIEQKISEAKTRPEAVKVALTGVSMGYKPKPIYRLKEIPMEYSFDPKHFGRPLVVEGEKRWMKRDWSLARHVSAGTYSKALVFTGYEGKTFSPTKRKKFEQWLQKNKIDRPENFLLLEILPRELKRWLDPTKVFPWSVVEAEVLPKRDTGTPGSPATNGLGHRPSGSYEGWIAGSKSVIEAKDINLGSPILYAVRKNGGFNLRIAFHRDPSATIVMLGLNRVNKFKRDFPSARELHEYNAASKQEWLASLTDDQKLWLYLKRGNCRISLNLFDPTKIEDPALAHAVKLAKQTNQALENAYQAYQEMPKFEWADPAVKYPLLLRSWYSTEKTALEHAYLYIAAVCAAESEKS